MWPRLPIKRIADVFLGKMIQSEPKSESDVAAPYLRAAHVQPNGQIIDVDDKTMWFRVGELAFHDLRRDDVVIVEGGAGYGRSAVIRDDRDGWGFQNSIVRVRPRPALANGRYLDYALQSALAAGEVEVACFTATIPHFTADKVGAFQVPAPPVGAQRAIADYLDRETALIDTLVEEQQRLIEMLDERRDVVIAEATTKGVSPGSALVESGVEWLGDVPEGWSVKALRRCGALVTGSTPPTDDRSNFAEEANERPWVRPQDLSLETRASAWLTAEGWSQLRPVPAGSVLIGCIAYSLGSVGYLPVAATTNQQITSVVPVEDGRYLYYVLRAAKSELWAASQMNRVPILNNQRLGAIRVPVPPVEEQRLIAAYLNEQTAKIDRTKAEAERFIELARERRAALITAAVTGQIDVREMA